MATLREIITRFRFKVDDAGMRRTDQGVRRIGQTTRRATKEAKKLGLAFAGVGVKVLQLASQAVRRGVGFLITDFARTTDEAAN